MFVCLGFVVSNVCLSWVGDDTFDTKDYNKIERRSRNLEANLHFVTAKKMPSSVDTPSLFPEILLFPSHKKCASIIGFVCG